ncbi:hypothetical protein BGZ93_005923 [Podila epicladia]|nr:hypothetical protein BGZ92_001456 [Podila epicladia]KAG0095402.1 hypothetical protein BGZ93_005923 [Podila epicladia]
MTLFHTKTSPDMILPLIKNTKVKASRQRVMLIMVLIMSSSLVFMILYRQALDEEFAMGSDQKPQLLKIPQTTIGVNERSLGYLPYAGLTNQHAAWVALHLNRTLILPPITSNKHYTQLTFQRWSTYFDIPRFEKLSGVRVKEWADVKPLTAEEAAIGVDVARRHKFSPQWDSLAENITCQITHGFGSLQGVNKIFTSLFLLRVSFVEPPPRPPSDHLENDAVSNAINGTPELSLLSDIIDRYRYSEEKSLYLSHAYGLKGSSRIRPWGEIGQHVHFKQEVVDLALNLVQSLQTPPRTNTNTAMPSPSPSHNSYNNHATTSFSSSPIATNAAGTTSHPSPSQITIHSAPPAEGSSEPRVTRPYIAVHLRRGDIINKCVNRAIGITQEAIDTCTPSVSRFAVEVEKARVELRARTAVDPLVVVTTDTSDQKDLDAIVALGWHRVDHVQAGTIQKLGIFGAAMVDAAILAHADVLVGTAMSTMSQIAELRQRSWSQRRTLYPRYEAN